MSSRYILDALRRAMTRRLTEADWPSVVAHELRQPLGTILLALGPIAANEDVHVRDAARRVRCAAFKLNRMVEDLVDEAAIRAGTFTILREDVDLRLVVADAVADAADFAGGRPLELEQPATPVIVAADTGRIEQVMTNLLTNAVKHGELDTVIRVRVLVQADAGEVVTSVTNAGEGLTPAEATRVFDRSYRTRRVRSGRRAGLGLGLHVARSVVERHGGRIGCATGAHETSFWFSLPLARG